MAHLYIFLLLLASIVIGYLIGSINFGKIVAKIIKINILGEGSKNPGATNLARLSKISYGVLVAFADLFKIILAGYLFYIVAFFVTKAVFQEIVITNQRNDFVFAVSYLIYLTPALAVFAHCYPIYSKFKHGGKGVASFSGLCFFISPWFGLFFFCLWWLLQLTIKYVSVASIVATLISSLFFWIPQLQNFYWISGKVYPYQNFINIHGIGFVDGAFVTFIFLILLSLGLFIVWRHRQNIYKLCTNQEQKFYFSSKKKNSNKH